MNTFAFLVFCVQACLVQNAYTACIGPAIKTAAAPCYLVANYAPAIVPTYAPACSLGFAAPAVVPAYAPACAPACAPAAFAPSAYAVTGSCGCGCNGFYF